jgi:hypothetical protein
VAIAARCRREEVRPTSTRKEVQGRWREEGEMRPSTPVRRWEFRHREVRGGAIEELQHRQMTPHHQDRDIGRTAPITTTEPLGGPQ